MDLLEYEELARHTSLELGGHARYFAEVETEEEVRDLLLWARESDERVVVLAGGSNVVFSDEGYPGLVLRIANRGIRVKERGDEVLVTAAAGESWDRFVELAVERDWAGLECLSGIPGSVGATPVQNVGAYGQEVSESLFAVRVLDRSNLETLELLADECDFAYRNSLFRRSPDRFVVLEVDFLLRPGGRASLRYPELVAKLENGEGGASLREVRRAVLKLRRKKSMVLDPQDPNRRSAGSFFLNPLLSTEEAEAVARRAVQLAAIDRPDEMPRFETSDGVKIPAAWLIQRAGFEKGLRRGPVGVSSRHSLALVHHGGGRTADLLALAEEIRDGVWNAFGVKLRPEPVFLGFSSSPLG